MKVVIVVEVDVSITMMETMKRAGFTVAQDGVAMQVKVPNSPNIPQRKTKVTFLENPANLADFVVSPSTKKTG